MSLSIHMRNYCEDLITWTYIFEMQKEIHNMSSGKKKITELFCLLNISCLSPPFSSPSQLWCRLLFPAPTPLHPQFPLGASSCGLAFYKIKYTPIIQSSNCLPWHLLPEVENSGPHKNLHRDFYNSSIHNRQNLETTTISCSNRRLQQLLHPDNGILFCVQKK